MKYKASCGVCTGTSHRSLGLPCQDRVAVKRGDALTVCALADGAGSRIHSDAGAACVTETVADLLIARFEQLWCMESKTRGQEVLHACIQALQKQEHLLYDLACTLLFCAAHRDGRYLAGHLGDGMMILDQDGVLSVFSMPENGEYRNETYFVTGANALEHLRLYQGQWTGNGTLLMMSDGVADSLYQYSENTPAAACSVMSSWLRQEDEDVISRALVQNMEQRLAKRTTDDMSLVLLLWEEESEQAEKNEAEPPVSQIEGVETDE